MGMRGWRTCTEQREGDGEEEEEDDEADVPPQRRDPKNTQGRVSATARNERCWCGRCSGLIVASASWSTEKAVAPPIDVDIPVGHT